METVFPPTPTPVSKPATSNITKVILWIVGMAAFFVIAGLILHSQSGHLPIMTATLVFFCFLGLGIVFLALASRPRWGVIFLSLAFIALVGVAVTYAVPLFTAPDVKSSAATNPKNVDLQKKVDELEGRVKLQDEELVETNKIQLEQSRTLSAVTAAKPTAAGKIKESAAPVFPQGPIPTNQIPVPDGWVLKSSPRQPALEVENTSVNIPAGPVVYRYRTIELGTGISDLRLFVTGCRYDQPHHVLCTLNAINYNTDIDSGFFMVDDSSAIIETPDRGRKVELYSVMGFDTIKLEHGGDRCTMTPRFPTGIVVNFHVPSQKGRHLSLDIIVDWVNNQKIHYTGVVPVVDGLIVHE